MRRLQPCPYATLSMCERFLHRNSFSRGKFFAIFGVVAPVDRIRPVPALPDRLSAHSYSLTSVRVFKCHIPILLGEIVA